MNGKIFIAYHYIPEPGDPEYRSDDLYQPVVMGHEIGDRPDLLSDLHGDAPGYAPLSIVAGYDEICTKWYVWKNLLSKYDWFGFQQYRRPMNFDGRSNDEIRALVKQYDIITSGPDEATAGNPNIKETFKKVLFPISPCPWTAFEKLMGDGWNFTMPLNHAHNTWIMRADEFDRFMTLWSKIFLELATIVPHNPPPSARTKPTGEVIPLINMARMYGYLTERFFTLYLDRLTRERPDAKVLLLPGIQTPRLA